MVNFFSNGECILLTLYYPSHITTVTLINTVKKKDIHMQKEAPGAPVNNVFPEFAKMK